MNIPVLTPIKRWLERRQRSSGVGPDDTEQWLIDAMGGLPSRAGVSVNNYTAMRLTAVFACVRIISESMASLPLKIYRRTGTGKEEARDHPLWRLLHDAPNDEMTAMQFRETLQSHILLWGNAYAYVGWDAMGQPKELYPLMPNVTRVQRGHRGDRLVYTTTLPTGEHRRLDPKSVLHIRGLGWDGVTGYSPIQMAREAIGMGLAAEEFGARVFGQGTHLGGVVEHPESLSEPAYQRLKTSMEEKYQGLGKSHLLLILEEGAKFEKIGIPPNEAQWIDARKFQIQEIARIYRVPPHMLADLERSTHTNIEHQAMEFVTQTLRPWLVRWEQAIKQRLITNDEYSAEHVVEGLLRGDIQARYNAYSIGRQNGWLSADEIRAKENENPLPDGIGEQYWQPMNMGVMGEEPPEPTPAAEPEDEEEEDERQVRSRPKQRRAAKARERIARRHEEVFKDAFGRIIGAEKRDVVRKAKQELGERDAGDFLKWLKDYYMAFPTTASKKLLPAASILYAAIREDVAAEVGIAPEVPPEMQVTMQERMHSAAEYHAVTSRTQIEAVMGNALEKGDDPFAAVRDRVDEWELKRPDKEARDITVRESNHIAERTYKEAGYTFKVWVVGGPNPCDFCLEMDGRVVGIEGTFLDKGDKVEVDDPDDPDKTLVMDRSRSVRNPPLHNHCQCQIEGR